LFRFNHIDCTSQLPQLICAQALDLRPRYLVLILIAEVYPLIMALRRCTRSVDGTIPIPALLYDDEELLASQENVGVYDGYVYFQMLYLCLRFSRVPLLHPSHPHIALVIFPSSPQ